MGQDIETLADLCLERDTLRKLKSITLTAYHQTPWTHAVLLLLSAAPLQIFQIYSTGASMESGATEEFWRSIVDVHGFRLTRFSVHRMSLSLSVIEYICARCTALEQLFITVEYGAMVNCLLSTRIISYSGPSNSNGLPRVCQKDEISAPFTLTIHLMRTQSFFPFFFPLML